MPNIKKPFDLTGKSCYLCGELIEHGTLNWTYNTHQAGLYRHLACSSVTLGTIPFGTTQLTMPVITLPQGKRITLPSDIFEEPKKVEPKPVPTTVATTRQEDITDKIVCTHKHYQTQNIKLRLRQRRYPFLYGAPGAGKTHLAKSLAEDMGLPFYLISCSLDMFKSEIIGSRSPINGQYFTTQFRQGWEKGGVILFDEVGLAPGSFLNILNAALAQKELAFPDGATLPMHQNCFIMFADNSALYGNDPMFPERQDAGGAFRDRITYIKFEYDEKLELRIVLQIFEKSPDAARATNFHRHMLQLRKEIAALNVPVYVSPRFVYAAAQDVLDGVPWKTIVEQNLLKGINGDIANLCQQSINAVDKKKTYAGESW